VNGCLSHCTADLQAVSFPDAPTFTVAGVELFVLPQVEHAGAVRPRLDERLPAGIPPRILLHSFLI
jgi:hypothetical protein